MNIIPIKQEMSDGFNNTEITVSWGGYAEADAAWYGKNVCASFSRIYYIKDGSANLHCRNKKITMKSGYMYLIPIGLKFSHECPDKMTQVFFHINMHKGGSGDFLRNVNEIKEIYVGDEIIKQAEEYISSETYADIVGIKRFLYESVMKFIEDEHSESLLPHRSELIGEVLKYVNINLSMKLRTEDIAEHFSVSRSTLNRRFKKEMGTSLHNYIEDLVFYWAEKMIVEEKYSLSQISDMIGFCDQFYFSKRFMLRYGKSPLNYRKEHS